jgi:hypothetical protein
MTEPRKQQALKLLAIIVDRRQTRKVVDILYEDQVRFHFIALAEGTAGTDLMVLLGLDTVDKSLICCLHTAEKIPELLRRIAERLQLRKPGKGIAFTMSLNGVNSSVLQLLTKDTLNDTDGEEPTLEKKKMETAHHRKYSLILSIVNQGCADSLMEAAKSAGARGGTVLHGRKMGVEEDVKFLGISIQSEKDIVAILTTQEQKNDIMSAISQACGMSTEARGVIISLPVDDIEGLGSVTSYKQKD